MMRARLMTAMYLLGKRRAEAKARREREALAEEFEAYNEAVDAEFRSLRQEVARLNMIEIAAATERPEGWLH